MSLHIVGGKTFKAIRRYGTFNFSHISPLSDLS